MRTRTKLIALAVGILLVAAACLNRAQRDDARAIALGDPRFEQILEEHTYKVTALRRPTYETKSDAVVEITFDEPLPIDEWPSDVCSISGSSQPATGARWLVDLDADAVLAVTPLWGTVACLVV